MFAGVRRPEDGEALRAKAAHPERVVPVILDVTKPVRATGRLGWRVLPQVCLDYGMQLSVDDVSFLLSPYMTHTGSNRRGARYHPVGAGGARRAAFRGPGQQRGRHGKSRPGAWDATMRAC